MLLCVNVDLIQVYRLLFDRATCHDECVVATSLSSSATDASNICPLVFIVTRRLYNAIIQVIFFILLMTLIIPDQHIYARNVVSFVRRFYSSPYICYYCIGMGLMRLCTP